MTLVSFDSPVMGCPDVLVSWGENKRAIGEAFFFVFFVADHQHIFCT